MQVLLSIFQRDIAVAYRQKAELMQPLFFFIVVVSLFPLAVGPNPDMLQRIGPGVIWVAAILSLLMGMDRVFKDDYVDGTLEQYVIAKAPLYAVLSVKVIAHWAMQIVPLLLVSPLLAMFVNMSLDMYWALLLTLVLGTPLVSFVGAIGVALTLNLQRSGVLLALILLPIFVPLLIFATSAIDSASMQLPYAPQLAIIAAMLLFSMALSPVAISYSIKVSLN